MSLQDYTHMLSFAVIDNSDHSSFLAKLVNNSVAKDVADKSAFLSFMRTHLLPTFMGLCCLGSLQ